MRPHVSRLLFPILALAFVGGGVFHALALVDPTIAEPVPAWYHLLFVGVNLALAILVVRRPPWLVPLFAVYLVQQYAEHLPRCVLLWREHGRFDLPGFAPLVFVPCVLALLVWDARTRRADARPAG